MRHINVGLAVSLVTGFACTSATQAHAQSACDSFRSSIDAKIKDLSDFEVDGLGDNSAPRAQLREERKANALRHIEISIALMAQNKCPPLTEPINQLKYVSNALSCQTEILKGVKDSPACDRSSWR